jgi:hypothetical protein
MQASDAPRRLHPEDLLQRRRPLVGDALVEQPRHRVLPARVDGLLDEERGGALEVI